MKTNQLGAAIPLIPMTLDTGGDVGGTLPGGTVVTGIQGVPVCVTAPSLDDVLTFDGSEWCPSPPAPTGVDVTDGTITVSAATTLTVPAGGVTAISGTNAGLEFLTNVNGGGAIVKSHGAMGATETINLADGNYHYGTLDADCTFTFTVIAGARDREFWLELLEDGTGGWTPTFPGSVVFPGGTPTHDTTAGTTTIYGFITRDAGTTWIGGMLGGGGSALTIKDEGTPLATAATSLDFVGAGVVASGATAAKTITIPGYTLTVDDEGTPLSTGATTLDFVGAGVTASGTGATKTITIAGVTAAIVAAFGFVGELLVEDGSSAPPVTLTNEAEDDWLYADVA